MNKFVKKESLLVSINCERETNPKMNEMTEILYSQ